MITRKNVPTAAELLSHPRDALLQWCRQNGRYGLVTKELVEWLHVEIGGRKAIEIGAGMGDLGSALGIHMTDSAIQTTPDLRARVESSGRVIIDPPPDVERINAADAIEKYKPQVVVGSWITQLVKESDDIFSIGSIYGVDEMNLIKHVETYIHIGNLNVHYHKHIMDVPHRTYSFPWLVSSALRPELNQIWVWDRSR